MSAVLRCERCGYEREVGDDEMVDEKGRPVSVTEYKDAIALTGAKLLCDQCVTAEDEPA